MPAARTMWSETVVASHSPAVCSRSHSASGRLKQSSRARRPAARARRAASIASSVLPVPAGPSKTTRGMRRMWSSASNCDSV